MISDWRPPRSIPPRISRPASSGNRDHAQCSAVEAGAPGAPDSSRARLSPALVRSALDLLRLPRAARSTPAPRRMRRMLGPASNPETAPVRRLRPAASIRNGPSGTCSWPLCIVRARSAGGGRGSSRGGLRSDRPSVPAPRQTRWPQRAAAAAGSAARPDPREHGLRCDLHGGGRRALASLDEPAPRVRPGAGVGAGGGRTARLADPGRGAGPTSRHQDLFQTNASPESSDTRLPRVSGAPLPGRRAAAAD